MTEMEKMLQESKKALNIFEDMNMDIEKIQEEIECDLKNATEKNSEETGLRADWLEIFEPKPVEPEAETQNLSAFPTVPATSDFYRETIKNTHREKPSGWFAKAVALFLVFTLGTGSLGFGLGAGFGYFNRQSVAPVVAVEESPVQTGIASVSHNVGDALQQREAATLADIVEVLLPSVVGVTTYPGENARARSTRYGSGVIFAETDERIFIVTSNYVVSGGSRVTVSIDGSLPIDAHPSGVDSSADLSVIAVYKTQLASVGIDRVVIATFGDSDQMRVGDTVLAIGNVMGEGNAVTRGVISASEKTITLPNTGHLLSVLQTDAAINYGNSGGPLINARGEIIGININQATGIMFGMTSVEGMGYSISSNIVVPILDELVSGRRPALGIMGQTIPEDLAADLRIPPIGVFVDVVIEGRAAYRGGMQAHDIITGFNGQPVFNWPQLVYAIRTSRIGDQVEVRVLRNGTEAIALYIELDVMVVDNF